MPGSVDLRQERANVWKQAQALLQTAEDEKRAMSPEEQEQWDRMMADMDELKGRIDTLERADAISASMATYERKTDEGADTQSEGAQEPEKRAYRAAFDVWMRYGRDGLDGEQRKRLAAGYEQFEQRALSSITGSAGAFTIPEGDMAPLVEAMADWGGMREAPTDKLTTADGREIPWPTADDTANQGRRIGENVQVSTAEPTYGAKILRAYLYTTDAVLVPYALLQDAGFDVAGFIMRAFGTRFGRIMNSEDTTGTGDSMPEGIIAVADVGETAAGADDITWADLTDLEHSVIRAYRRSRSCAWMFNDNTLKYLKQLEDGQSRPLWVPGLAYNAPDRIAGYPYVINTDMADIATTAKAVAFGDWSYYKIRDVSGVQMLRLEERYADYGQVGFLGFMRHDGKYVDPGSHPIKVMQQA